MPNLQKSGGIGPTAFLLSITGINRILYFPLSAGLFNNDFRVALGISKVKFSQIKRTYLFTTFLNVPFRPLLILTT